MAILVTGGAGYIGAHVVAALTEAGRGVVVVDDESTGSRERIPGTPLELLDVAAPDALDALARIMTAHDVDAVIHLAARKRVDESVGVPLWYYQQNVGGLQNLLTAMVAAGVRRLVFSSSAAVYGETSQSQVSEVSPTAPVNPYGRTKLIGEWLCRDVARTGALDVIALRYFNVAGAARPNLGDPAVMNLVTMVIERLRRGLPPVIYGDDYATPDGTCVRDFVHVRDLADAHLTAVDALADGRVTGFDAFNVGTGEGGSVREVVERLVELSGSGVTPVIAERRAGDPAAVVASAALIGDRLGWKSRADLREILDSAWAADAPRFGTIPAGVSVR